MVNAMASATSGVPGDISQGDVTVGTVMPGESLSHRDITAGVGIPSIIHRQGKVNAAERIDSDSVAQNITNRNATEMRSQGGETVGTLITSDTHSQGNITMGIPTESPQQNLVGSRLIPFKSYKQGKVNAAERIDSDSVAQNITNRNASEMRSQGGETVGTLITREVRSQQNLVGSRLIPYKSYKQGETAATKSILSDSVVRNITNTNTQLQGANSDTQLERIQSDSVAPNITKTNAQLQGATSVALSQSTSASVEIPSHVLNNQRNSLLVMEVQHSESMLEEVHYVEIPPADSLARASQSNSGRNSGNFTVIKTPPQRVADVRDTGNSNSVSTMTENESSHNVGEMPGNNVVVRNTDSENDMGVQNVYVQMPSGSCIQVPISCTASDKQANVHSNNTSVSRPQASPIKNRVTGVVELTNPAILDTLNGLHNSRMEVDPECDDDSEPVSLDNVMIVNHDTGHGEFVNSSANTVTIDVNFKREEIFEHFVHQEEG